MTAHGDGRGRGGILGPTRVDRPCDHAEERTKKADRKTIPPHRPGLFPDLRRRDGSRDDSRKDPEPMYARQPLRSRRCGVRFACRKNDATDVAFRLLRVRRHRRSGTLDAGAAPLRRSRPPPQTWRCGGRSGAARRATSHAPLAHGPCSLPSSAVRLGAALLTATAAGDLALRVTVDLAQLPIAVGCLVACVVAGAVAEAVWTGLA